MTIRENVPLANFTTLRIGGPARFFAEANSIEDIKETLEFAHKEDAPVFVLGGGSNILVSDDGFAGLVLKINIRGRELFSQNENEVILKIGAGEVLDEVIDWVVENGWWGIENLSFVPGTIGGAIYMNAGCYGEEIAEVVEQVTVWNLEEGRAEILAKDSCSFTYRRSRFNGSDKGKFIILEAVIKLKTSGIPNLGYADLEKWFLDKSNPSQKEVRDALIAIRTAKGQDLSKVWSAGSFFSNFKLTKDEFVKLLSCIEKSFSKELASDLEELVKKVKAPSDGDKIKVPAAFILDKLLGLKGYKIGGAMHSPMQVLNLINTGGAKAGDLILLYENARKLVLKKTGLTLVPEPEFVGFE